LRLPLHLVVYSDGLLLIFANDKHLLVSQQANITGMTSYRSSQSFITYGPNGIAHYSIEGLLSHQATLTKVVNSSVPANYLVFEYLVTYQRFLVVLQVD
jgi:hypothetical protein